MVDSRTLTRGLRQHIKTSQEMLHVQKDEPIHMQRKRLTKFMVQLAEVILTVLLAQV